MSLTILRYPSLNYPQITVHLLALHWRIRYKPHHFNTPSSTAWYQLPHNPGGLTRTSPWSHLPSPWALPRLWPRYTRALPLSSWLKSLWTIVKDACKTVSFILCPPSRNFHMSRTGTSVSVCGYDETQILWGKETVMGERFAWACTYEPVRWMGGCWTLILGFISV